MYWTVYNSDLSDFMVGPPYLLLLFSLSSTFQLISLQTIFLRISLLRKLHKISVLSMGHDAVQFPYFSFITLNYNRMSTAVVQLCNINNILPDFELGYPIKRGQVCVVRLYLFFCGEKFYRELISSTLGLIRSNCTHQNHEVGSLPWKWR